MSVNDGILIGKILVVAGVQKDGTKGVCRSLVIVVQKKGVILTLYQRITDVRSGKGYPADDVGAIHLVRCRTAVRGHGFLMLLVDFIFLVDKLPDIRYIGINLVG